MVVLESLMNFKGHCHLVDQLCNLLTNVTIEFGTTYQFHKWLVTTTNVDGPWQMPWWIFINCKTCQKNSSAFGGGAFRVQHSFAKNRHFEKWNANLFCFFFRLMMLKFEIRRWICMYNCWWFWWQFQYVNALIHFQCIYILHMWNISFHFVWLMPFSKILSSSWVDLL
jgi:hypothetical protein